MGLKWVFVFLLFLIVSCQRSVCPEGYFLVGLPNGSACISNVSFCQSDRECTAAKYHCANPCENIAVNIANIDQANAKAASCASSRQECRTSPELVRAWCSHFECHAKTVFVEDLVTNPVYGQPCYTVKSGEYLVQLAVENKEGSFLTGLDAILTGDKKTGSASVPYAFVMRSLLEQPLALNEKKGVVISLREEEIGRPVTLALYAARNVSFEGKSLGQVVNKAHPIRFENITSCR